MIVRTRGGVDREIRAAPFDSSQIPWPPVGWSWLATSGERVTLEKATALPAVFNAIRLIAETTGRLPLRVYKGFQESKRTQENTWQWDLLHRRPNPERSAFDFWQDVAACVETHGNAYLQKAKSRSRVEALFLIRPDRVTVTRDQDTGELLYTVGRVELTSADILHIRGLNPFGGDVGVSPIQNEAIGSALARYAFEGNFFRNDAVPPAIIEDPAPPNRDKALVTAAVWKASHSGSNAGNVGVLMGGAKLTTFGLPLKDAQFIEAHEFSVKDVARIYNIAVSLLNGADTQPTEEESRRFLNFGLSGRLARISEALHVDEDLFPARSGLYPEFFVDDFIRADALGQAQIRHLKIQDGSLLVDEARAEDGREPLRPPPPDRPGLIPQIVPVGGGPNPVAANGASQNGSTGG